MAAAPKDADVRSTIRGILISTPKEMRLHQLNKDFLEMEGQHIPYAKFGFRNLLEYLHSIPDTVSIMDSSSNPVILPVTSERSSHVEKLVLRQKINPPKRGGFHQVPSRRSLNHVSPNSCKRTRSRKKGLVSRMPESRPHANANEKGESLHRSSDKTDNTKKNNSNPFQNRPTIDIKCLQEQINEFQKYNCSTYKNNDIQNKKPYQCQKDTVKKGDTRNVPNTHQSSEVVLGGSPFSTVESTYFNRKYFSQKLVQQTPRIHSLLDLKFDANHMERMLRGGPAFHGSRHFDNSHVAHHPLTNYRQNTNFCNFRNPTVPVYPFTRQPLIQSRPPVFEFQASNNVRRSFSLKTPLLEDPVIGKSPRPYTGSEPKWNNLNSKSSPAVPPPVLPTSTGNTYQSDNNIDNRSASQDQKGKADICPAGAERSCRSPDRFGSSSETGSPSSGKNNWAETSKASSNICPAGAEGSWKDSVVGLSCGNESNDCSVSDYKDSQISNRMQANFRTLLRRNPDGIFCSDLPALYETEFNAPFCCQDYGYNSVIQMVSDHPNIFSFTRFDKTGDWLLKTPSAHGQDKSNNLLTPKRWVTKKIIQNILRILEQFPGGLPLSELLQKYEDFTQEKFDFTQFGESLEEVMNGLENHVHQRRIGGDIVLYEASKFKKIIIDDKSLAASPALPDSIQINELHKDLYPEEVCNQDDVIPPQKLPELRGTRFFEVRVSDIENPDRMWFHLGKCYEALETMMGDLDEFYNTYVLSYEMPELTIRPLQLCACLFKAENFCKWHRAIICRKDNDNVLVQYIDYGTTRFVSRSFLRFLHKDFMKLPSQAIEGKLLNLYPPVGCKDWPIRSQQYLHDLTFDKRLMFELVMHNKEKRRIEGFLYNTNGEEDIVINDELVNNGYAVMNPPMDENEIKSESLINEQYTPQLCSPTSSEKSNQALLWNCSTNFEDRQSSSGLKPKYYETNTTNSYTDSSSGYHSATSKVTPYLPSSSPPFTYTFGNSSSCVSDSISPHSRNSSMSPNSQISSPFYRNPSISSHSPDIYYGSEEHLNNVPCSTLPLNNTLNKISFPELSRSPSNHSSSSRSFKLSSPLSSSPKSEFVGDPFRVLSVNTQTAGDPFQTSSVNTQHVADPFRIPSSNTQLVPSTFTVTTTTVTTTSNASNASTAFELPHTRRPPPGFGNEEQKKPVNNLPHIPNYPLPTQNWNGAATSQASSIFTPPLMPMLPNYSPNLWPTTQPIPNYLGFPPYLMFPLLNNPLLQQSLQGQNTMFQPPTMSHRGPNTAGANSFYNQTQVQIPTDSSLNLGYSSAVSTTVDQESVKLPSNSEKVYSEIGISCSQTATDLSKSNASVETVEVTNDTFESQTKEITYLTCADTDSVCSDWEAYETANETAIKSNGVDSESVFSDVETDDATTKKSRGTPSTSSAQSDGAQPVVKNPLEERILKPMSNSARKRLRKTLAKNKINKMAAEILVIDDHRSIDSTSPQNVVANGSAGSTTMLVLDKESEDSKSTSNSTMNDLKEITDENVTSKKNKNKKKQVNTGKVQEIQSRSKKLPAYTSLRRPKCKEILMEILNKDSNLNDLKNDESSTLSEDLKSGVKVSKSVDKVDESDEKVSKKDEKASKKDEKASKKDEKASKKTDKEVPYENSSLKSDAGVVCNEAGNNPSINSDSLPKENITANIKRELVKDWKLLDNISKENIYATKPVEGSSSETKEEYRESQCDMIDRIIISLNRANVFGKAVSDINDSTPKELVQRKVINSKTVHVFVHNNQLTVCTDEIITSFTKFSKRLAVNKALDCKQVIKPYFDVTRKNDAQLFKLLDNCKISGVTKEGNTQLPDKLSILPLENVSVLLRNLGADPSIVDSFTELCEELNVM